MALTIKDLSKSTEIVELYKTPVLLVDQYLLQVKLQKHQEALKSVNEWHTPASFVVAFGLAMVAASSYRSFWIISKELIQALVIVLFLASLCWLIYKLFKQQKGPKTPEEFIEDLKKSAPTISDSEISKTIRVSKK